MKKTLIYILLSVMFTISFYKFMTYDRNYSWTKEFHEDVKIATQKSEFKIQKTEKIEAKNVKLSFEKSLKIKIQKLLNKIGLMNYGTEYGEIIYLVSENEKLNFKSWCLSDHIIGIEIEVNNIPEDKLKFIKKEVEKGFDNYKIIWTKI
ncbi:hypothetical protein ABGT15_13120 [Flavobacterium enshiense]|uniref:hypothetical protein n=1 Tax=Flavobacterium enshiense TaxID=1341165 RepID=UPI00345DBCC3